MGIAVEPGHPAVCASPLSVSTQRVSVIDADRGSVPSVTQSGISAARQEQEASPPLRQLEDHKRVRSPGCRVPVRRARRPPLLSMWLKHSLARSKPQPRI